MLLSSSLEDSLHNPGYQDEFSRPIMLSSHNAATQNQNEVGPRDHLLSTSPQHHSVDPSGIT